MKFDDLFEYEFGVDDGTMYAFSTKRIYTYSKDNIKFDYKYLVYLFNINENKNNKKVYGIYLVIVPNTITDKLKSAIKNNKLYDNMYGDDKDIFEPFNLFWNFYFGFLSYKEYHYSNKMQDNLLDNKTVMVKLNNIVNYINNIENKHNNKYIKAIDYIIKQCY